MKSFVRSYGMVIILVVMFALLYATVPTFRNPQNLLNLLQQNSVNAIIASGVTFVLITGGIDLSVGSTAALAGMAGAAVMVRHGILLGVLAGLAAATAAGLLNGLLISRAGIVPFVTTLGVQTLTRGILYIATNATPIYGLPFEYMRVGLGNIGPFPIATSLAVVIAVVMQVLLKHTPYGQYVLALGGNEDATRLSGIDVKRTKTVVYTVTALLAGVGGLILLGQTNTGQPQAAVGYELNAIAAVVVGGTPLSGGQGSVLNTIIGVLVLGLISNALNLMNVSPYWQPAVTGLIILLAVGLDTATKGHR
ncbi:MAG: Ribose transport system permease protein RbsC [Firmicutes bacterium ADurb.Bin506]|jgi:ribose transport system permease protein|nr:MAG: Ribose transport system permease protein RbsC [Firmicutes bacterium ADurb.Bin506]